MIDIDIIALSRWLQKKMPGGNNLTLEPISGGQSNPTWFVNWNSKQFVLRKKPAGPILPGAHAVEREFRVMQSLASTDVPVPEVLWLEEDTSILGTPFYLMERVEGRVFSDCSLPDCSPSERREIYLEMARTLAKLHRVRPDKIGLSDYGRPSGYFKRQIARWSKQYMASSCARISALDKLVEWLPTHLPKDDGAVSIAHGDFRLGNLMFHPTLPKVVSVLDWELSTLGHPLADLGFSVMPWLTAPDEYGGILGTDWEKDGIPSMLDFIENYYSHALPTQNLKPFHMSFALFRFAVIFIGIVDRAKAGNSASENADQLGPLAELFALRALDIVE